MATGLLDVLSIQGVTFPSVNVSSSARVGAEKKNERYTLYLSVSATDFPAHAFCSLQLSLGSKDITAAQAKKLPGVTAGENITVRFEMLADAIHGGRDIGLDIDFYTDTGVRVQTQEIRPSVAGVWEPKKATYTVPVTATRINWALVGNVAENETVKAWFARLRITR